MTTKRHKHCWHVTSSTTNGMGVRGYDSVRCCYCDARGQRDWMVTHDPAHGPFCENTVFKYVKYKIIKVKR